MPLARIVSFSLDGVGSRRVWVEADIRSGLPAFTVVGLADKAVREARERVRSAIVNSGFEFPLKRITVNLAPAYLHKVGPAFDLPLAVAVLVASGQVAPEAVAGIAICGELSLAGEVRAIRGALAIAEGTRAHGLRRLVVPRDRAREAALVEDLEVAGVTSLVEAVAVLRGEREPEVPPEPPPREVEPLDSVLDLSDVRGHNVLIEGVVVAAAGGHNLYLHGPPGTGKTMLARRIGSLLPPLTREEAIGVTRIHSVAGLHHGGGALVAQRPFRAPHHTISPAGLVGGGSSPMPGEVTLAHHGVLFLDELSEFSRPSLEALRQPLEEGEVAIVRGQRLVLFPSRCMLVAASNPCPCGMGGGACACTAADVARHRRRLSGPLLDRIDITLEVNRPCADALRHQVAPSSASQRERVVEARERQAHRFAHLPITSNAEMSPRMLRELACATEEADATLHALYDHHGLSARGHARVLRIARTVADLEGCAEVEAEHVREAAGHRTDLAKAAA